MRGEKLRANLPLFMGRTDRRGKFVRWQKKRFSVLEKLKWLQHHLPARIYGIFGGKKISFFWF